MYFYNVFRTICHQFLHGLATDYVITIIPKSSTGYSISQTLTSYTIFTYKIFETRFGCVFVLKLLHFNTLASYNDLITHMQN